MDKRNLADGGEVRRAPRESSIDVMLDSIDSLGASTSMMKTWPIAPLSAMELSELSVTFLGAPDGSIETERMCEAEVEVGGLCQWLDAQDDATISVVAGSVTQWTSKVGDPENYGATGSETPTLTTVGGKQYLRFDGSDVMAESDVDGDSCVSKPGAGDFTTIAVYRARNTITPGWIWGYGTARRWLMRTAPNGSDFQFSIDDDTTAFTITASDVDFANDDVYVVIGIREGDFIRFYFGNGGALAESAASPVALGSGYGSLTQPTNAQIGNVLAGGAQALIGEIGELRFYNRALPSGERSIVYSELVTKWAL